MKNTLAERLTYIVEQSGLKQTAFAKSVGVTPNYISMIMHGKKDLISPTLAMLIQFLYGYSANWLLNGIGPMMDKKSYIKRINEKLENLTPEEIEKVDHYLEELYG